MNAATQALSAALFLVGTKPDFHYSSTVVDLLVEMPGVDVPLDTLTGDELESLTKAADIIRLRADAIRRDRVNAAVRAEILKTKTRKADQS